MRTLAALAIVCLVGCAEVAPYSNARWGFATSFPYSVKEKERGGGLALTSSNPSDTISYLVSVLPLDDATLKQGPARILADAIDATLRETGGKLISTSDVTLDGFSGKQFEIRTDGMIATCRLYLVGDRLYLPMLIAAAYATPPMDAATFLAAFKLLDPPKR